MHSVEVRNPAKTSAAAFSMCPSSPMLTAETFQPYIQKGGGDARVVHGAFRD